MKLPFEKALAETKALQTQMGQEFEQQLRQGSNLLSCSKGCSYCCHHPFLITILEGLLLYRHLTARGKWTPSLQKKLKADRDKTLKLSFDIWLLSNIPCPLLEEKLCVAYERRPLYCRATFSTGDPLLCHPHELSENIRLTQGSEIVIEFNINLQNQLERLETAQVLMPLSEAILLSEALESETLEVGNLGFQYMKDRFSD